jgi:hypothetical protein
MWCGIGSIETHVSHAPPLFPRLVDTDASTAQQRDEPTWHAHLQAAAAGGGAGAGEGVSQQVPAVEPRFHCKYRGQRTRQGPLCGDNNGNGYAQKSTRERHVVDCHTGSLHPHLARSRLLLNWVSSPTMNYQCEQRIACVARVIRRIIRINAFTSLAE